MVPKMSLGFSKKWNTNLKGKQKTYSSHLFSHIFLAAQICCLQLQEWKDDSQWEGFVVQHSPTKLTYLRLFARKVLRAILMPLNISYHFQVLVLKIHVKFYFKLHAKELQCFKVNLIKIKWIDNQGLLRSYLSWFW